MPDLKTCLVTVVFSVWLVACTEQPQTNQTTSQQLQVTISSPISPANEMQSIDSFDVYVDRQTIHAVFTNTGSEAKQTHIGYLHSEDGGSHWSVPQDIAAPFNLPIESKAGNDIQIAANDNTLLVIWQTTGEIPGMGPLTAIFSLDGGKTWQKGVNPTNSLTDQSHPDLAADQQGRFHMVWLDDRDENGHQGLRYARTLDASQHWDAQLTIDDSTCSCCWNRLLISSNGQLNVLYRDMEPRDMALAQSSNGGASWRQVSPVGQFNWQFEGCPHNGGGLTQAENGDLHSTVWTGAENQVGLYHLQSTDNGSTWAYPQSLAAGSGAFHSDIAALDEKRVIAIWDAMGPEGSSVLFAASSDNGQNWATARQLSAPDNIAMFPRIVATQVGWLAFWTEQQPKATKQWLSAVIR